MDLVQTIITGLCVAIPSVLATMVTSKQNGELTKYQINDLKEDFKVLATKVEKHNGIVERMAVAENDLKTLYKKIDDIKK